MIENHRIRFAVVAKCPFHDTVDIHKEMSIMVLYFQPNYIVKLYENSGPVPCLNTNSFWSLLGPLKTVDWISYFSHLFGEILGKNVFKEEFLSTLVGEHSAVVEDRRMVETRACWCPLRNQKGMHAGVYLTRFILSAQSRTKAHGLVLLHIQGESFLRLTSQHNQTCDFLDDFKTSKVDGENQPL